MKNIFETTINKRWLMMTLFILLSVFGYYSWTKLSIEAYPDIGDVTSQVVTQVPGLAAEEMEQQITIPIERAINGLPGMHVMRSKSTFGLSMVTIVFEDGVDDYFARTRIKERLDEVEIPYGAMPELDPLTSPTGEIYRYILESNSSDLRTLTDIQNFIIIPKLKQVPGVADVTNFGGITTQYQVELDPRKMEQFHISLSEVIETIEKNNANAGGSIVNRGDQSYVVRGIGLVKDLEDIGRIVVKSVKGVSIYLDDIGTLKYGNLERSGALGYTDKRGVNYSDNIQGIVLLLKGENPSIVLEGVNREVNALNKSGLPEGVRIHTVLDRTDLVDTTLTTISTTIMEGIGLVILILIIFLGSWRGALLVAITIPLSLLIAFILMKLTDIPANLLSLGAIDFGIIVDGAIVMMETILKKREDNPEKELTVKTVAKRAKDVARPIFFATLIIITAYLPLFAFERVENKLFTPMAFTVGYALLGALLVALILIPGLAYFVYKKPQKVYHNKWMERLTNAYHSRIQKFLKKPKRVFIPLGVVLAAAVILTISVGKDFLPPLDEGSIWLQVSLPPGITLDKSKEMSDALREVTMQHEEVTYIMVQAGRNDDGTDAWTASHLEASIGLEPYKQWKGGRRKADLVDDLAADYAKMPGYNIAFSQPMIDGVMDKIAGVHSELAIKIYGDDFKENRRIAEDIIRTLKTVKGAVDLAIDQEPPLPQIQINANRESIAQYGLNVADVSELIEVALGGKAISQIFVEDKVYGIIARYKEESRNTPEKIGNLMLTNAAGASIPLSQVTDITLNTGESTISREMNQRHLTVRLNLRGNDLSSFLKEAQDRIEKEVSYDHEHVSLSWGGQFENQNRAYRHLAIIVPLALFGGMLALNIRGMTLNVSSAVGFIALFGVAIQNGVIMISHINILRKEGTELFLAVLNGAKQRFRPVLMTASVAVLGLFPASLATGIGSDVQRPLATVIVYGLLFSTILTLFALPSLYYLLERKFEKKELSPSKD